ncbi:MAG: Two-component sensor histidine kinase, contains HisKA and HATPase domain [Alphaproteobacteria bacterium]|nr:Two-component sensor histidine kinase, contains HisKA and HATPase domain [Alphaproteobacteria bacterium]MDB5740802.1 Two-component sensor histidine kinase, contains HisKA and HATPase domain [Alphaproteobacteria bacterium]
MLNRRLTAQNTYLTEMLKQAGLDAEARDVAERIQTVLTDEIHHRMKNMLTMVTAIVRQSMRASASLSEAEAAISVRLLAMSKAHDLLLKADWKSAGLLDVVHGATEQHDTTEGRFVIAGSALQINSAAILPLTLALNELCTNAIKYGALAKAGGKVTISWLANEERLTLRWVECGGPVVIAPARNSFGTRLIEQALPRQLGGTGHMIFPPAGVEFELVIPLDRLLPLPVHAAPKENTIHA